MDQTDPVSTHARHNPLNGKIATNSIDLLELKPEDLSPEMLRYEWLNSDELTGKMFSLLPPIYENIIYQKPTVIYDGRRSSYTARIRPQQLENQRIVNQLINC